MKKLITKMKDTLIITSVLFFSFFLSGNAFARTVTYSGASTNFVTIAGSNVTVTSNVSSSGKTMSCISSSSVSYPSLNGSTISFKTTLDLSTEKIDSVLIVWMSNTTNQTIPYVWSEADIVASSSIATLVNGGINQTSAIATTGTTNCPGEKIKFPAGSKVKSFLIQRIMSYAPTTTLGTTYPSVSIRLNSSGSPYTSTAGTTSTAYVGSITLYISSLSPAISSFTAGGVTATINETSTPKTITAVLPYGTNMTSITPTVSVGGTATGYTPTGAQDFSNSATTPVIYTSTDGTNTTNYSVTLTASQTASSAKDLSGVTIGGNTPAFNSGTNTYSIILPKSTSLTQAVSFTLPIGASADFTSGNTYNFSSPLSITVTAQDNSTKIFTLQAINGVANIAYVTVDGLVNAADTQVYPDLLSKGYYVKLVNATTSTDLTPFSTSDLVILTESPGSTLAFIPTMAGLIGTKPFINMKSFVYGKTGWPTGTGANGTQDVGANVLNCYLNHPIFTGVTISGNTASILGTITTGNGVQGVTTPGAGSIIATLPSAATAACIVEQNTVPTAKYLLLPISTNNYNAVNASGLKLVENAISYLLGSSVYTLPSLQISSFTVNSVSATIDNTANTITAFLPIGTDLTTIQPAIVLQGTNTTVSPLSGAITDFSNSYTTPINYTVSDGCNNSKVYAVKVMVQGTGVSLPTISGVSFDGQTIRNENNQDLQVFDATGRMIAASNRNINMSSNSKGIYIVKGGLGTIKIAILK